MQIGPSLSVLQALGTHPGAPEPARMKPIADAAAVAQVSKAATPPDEVRSGVDDRFARVEPTAASAPAGIGRKLDIMV